MFFDRWLGGDGGGASDRRIASDLHAAAVAQSRQPRLYAVLGAPDTVEGRFELLTLHIILLLDRLREHEALRQDVFDTYVSNLDGALREMGVGDLSMGKRMRGLGEIFYGRVKAFDAAFSALPDESALGDLLARTVLADAGGVGPDGLAAYVARSRRSLLRASIEEIRRSQAAWTQS